MSVRPIDGGQSISYWSLHEEVPTFAPLSADTDADVCVVGGGIAGLSVAYELVCAGLRVVVLEDGEIGAGETARTTAHLSNAFDDGYVALERVVGVEGTRLAADGHTWAIERIAHIVDVEGLECGFAYVDGFLGLADGSDPDVLHRELAAARRAGVADVAWVDRLPLMDAGAVAGGVGHGPALCFPRQGQLCPLHYVRALAVAVARRGGRVHTHTRATRMHVHEVHTRSGAVVRCAATVNATFAPSSDETGPHRPDFSTWQQAYRTYVIAAPVPANALPFALYWDTCDPYHYVRLHRPSATAEGPAHDILMVGGEDHKAGQGGTDATAYTERYARIEQWMRDRFPMAGAVLARWSGQLMEPVDYLASIGRHPGASHDDSIYVVTGDSGHGMTHAVIAGRILTNLIAGRPDPWAELYDPCRLTLLPHDRSVLTALVSENVNALVARKRHHQVVDSTDEIPVGSGALVEHAAPDGNPGIAAVFRDANGALHERSAKCPHRGCTVSWNPAESTWDCPCHGSRFDAFGRVLDGPAPRDLDPR